MRELVKKSYTAIRIFVMSPVFLLFGDSEHDTDGPKIAISTNLDAFAMFSDMIIHHSDIIIHHSDSPCVFVGETVDLP